MCSIYDFALKSYYFAIFYLSPLNFIVYIIVYKPTHKKNINGVNNPTTSSSTIMPTNKNIILYG